MAMPEFPNEAEFRTKWIKPFLSKLGYVLVSHIHGSGEQGKDFFFADFDRFEHRRFYAVQAKVGKIGAGQTELSELLNQVQRCFSVRLRFHKDAHERRISAVYIMASGSISREAREYISDWCNSQSFGENVYYLDGDTLERLEKNAFQRFDLDLRNRLIAVMAECQHNIRIIQRAQQVFGERKSGFERCRLTALDALLVSVPPADVFKLELAEEAWRWLSLTNKFLDYHLLPFSTSDQEWAFRVQIADSAWNANLRLRGESHEAISILDARYSVAVEVVE